MTNKEIWENLLLQLLSDEKSQDELAEYAESAGFKDIGDNIVFAMWYFMEDGTVQRRDEIRSDDIGGYFYFYSLTEKGKVVCKMILDKREKEELNKK